MRTPFPATSIYNRTGTGHMWLRQSPPISGWARSFCGLSERLRNLDHDGVMKTCRKCDAAMEKQPHTVCGVSK